MSDDAERVEETAEDEETEEEVEEPEEEERQESRFSPKKVAGLIFNLRMLRRVVQIFFFLGINAYIFTAWFGMDQVAAFWTELGKLVPSLPILSPLEAPFAVIAGSFDAIQMTLTSGAFPFFVIGAMLIIVTVIGRSACGWVCPLGTMQDFMTLPKRKKVRPIPSQEKELRRVKAYIFVIVVFLAAWMGVATATGTEASLVAALGAFAMDAFSPLNPSYILFVVLPNQTWPVSLGTLWYFTVYWGWALAQFAFVIAVFVVSIWIPRWFCRWLCPAGWFYGLFSRDALVGIGRNPARCTPDV
ncbi:4Fe-4S binding protein, partial [Candidatus Thorarchaeota archaeon]